jgi:hypothetical protein
VVKPRRRSASERVVELGSSAAVGAPERVDTLDVSRPQVQDAPHFVRVSFPIEPIDVRARPRPSAMGKFRSRTSCDFATSSDGTVLRWDGVSIPVASEDRRRETLAS